jgi:GST-like protein
MAMIRLYFHHTPNPMKVALFLEETGIPYEVVPIDTLKGEQHAPQFRAINPNGKTPAIVDTEGLGEGPVAVFDSNAILLYFAEKTGKFLPPNTPADRARLLSWLMFAATGVGPFCGHAVHFKHFAPEKVPYANTRYQFEAERHFSILDGQLAKGRYMLGEVYTIVDMDVWGWARMAPFILGEDIWVKLPNLKRHHDEIAARPAAARAVALKDKFAFKPTMDDEARAVMFKHLGRAAA